MHRTTYTLTVLSEEPIPEMSLDALARECTEGAYALASTDEKSEVLTGAQMADALYEAGSEPMFFQLDDDGNRVEE